jgi:hypothetical protein
MCVTAHFPWPERAAGIKQGLFRPDAGGQGAGGDREAGVRRGWSQGTLLLRVGSLAGMRFGDAMTGAVR